MKEVFDLQKFAEDAADESQQAAGADDQQSEEKENESAGSADQKKYSDEDLDKIISKKFAKWAKQKDADIAKAKQESTMSAEQKAQARQKELEDQVAQLLASQKRAQQEKEAARAFKAKGINADEDLISFVIGSDSEATAANVEKMAAILSAERKAAEKLHATGMTPKSTSPSSTKSDPIQRAIDAWKK